MALRMIPFSPENHRKDVVADLIYKADEEMNYLVYGEHGRGVQTIVKLMEMDQGYFNPKYIQCVVEDEEVVGVVVGYPVHKKKEIDKASGKTFSKAMGTWTLFKNFPCS